MRPNSTRLKRVWLYLRERHLSHHLHHSYQAILDAACDAWRRVTPDKLQSLCAYPWIKQVIE